MTNHVQPLPETHWALRPKAVAVAGSILGLVAFWSAIPPFTARSPLVPILIGMFAIAAGLWAVTRGTRRAGWGAIASGGSGLGLGYLSTRSSSGSATSLPSNRRAAASSAAATCSTAWPRARGGSAGPTGIPVPGCAGMGGG